jgi:hypothetical protein
MSEVESGQELELLYFPPKQFSPRFGNNIFTVVIDGYEISQAADACFMHHAIYKVSISRGRSVWKVEHRFSDFDRFLTYLLNTYPKTIQPFPPLPAKTWFNIAYDEAFLAERLKELQVFLNDVLVTMNMEKLLNDVKLAEFLEFNHYVCPANNV